MSHKHSVFDKDTHFIIDPATRVITTTSEKLHVMQFDHNSETLTFEMPRYVEGHDMSLCNRVEAHFLNIDTKTRDQISGHRVLEDFRISKEDESKVVVSWTITKGATKIGGLLHFLLNFRCLEGDVETYAWHTDFFKNYTVKGGLDAAALFEDEYVDVIEQWKASVMQHFTDDLTAWKEEKAEELEEGVNKKVAEHSARWNAALEVERRRIDNIVALKDGSTTGDAELIDGRNDGITIHANVGNAIRAKTKADFELLDATKLAQPNIPFLDRLEIGFVQIGETDLTYKEYANYVRTKKEVTIHLEAGDAIVCKNETRVYAGFVDNDKYSSSGWTSNFIAEVKADYVLLFSYYDTKDIVDLDSFLENITIIRFDSYSVRTEKLNKDTTHLLRLENTYLSRCELYVGDATTTNAMRFCAKLKHPVYGAKIAIPDTIRYAIQGYSDEEYKNKTYDSGWKTGNDFVLFEDAELYYVVVFIRIDGTKPTIENMANTIVLQSLNLTPIIDRINGQYSSSALAYYDSTNDVIKSVAHRGLSDVAPENTLPAFVLAKQAGFTYVEADIQVTKDGKYVCVHDKTISKYTNGANTGAVADYTLAELKALDFGAWKSTKWTGTKILTFEEFIILCKKLGLKAYIELKYAHSESDVAYYLSYVKKIGMEEYCVWRGAENNSIIRKLSKTAVLAYDATSIMTQEKVEYIVEKYSPLFFHNDYSSLTEEIVEICHNNGVCIEVYTVNDETVLERLVEMGVDGITTDKLISGKFFFEKLMKL